MAEATTDRGEQLHLNSANAVHGFFTALYKTHWTVAGGYRPKHAHFGDTPHLAVRANAKRNRVTSARIEAASIEGNSHDYRLQFPSGQGGFPNSVILEEFVAGELVRRAVADLIDDDTDEAELLGEMLALAQESISMYSAELTDRSPDRT